MRTEINKMTYLNASWKISNPSVITNFPIKQNTPIGAKEIIIITSCINTVFNFSNASLKLPVRWFVLFKAKPNKMLKKTTANIWFWAMASIIFDGKMSRIVSYIPWPSGRFSGGAIFEEYPAPGLNIEPTIKDRLTAIAVVDKYNVIVLKVIFPKLVMLVREEIPETSEKKTRGTINSFNRLTKIALPKLNT